MDRKTEIKQDIWVILKEVYRLNTDSLMTSKQEEFLDRTVDYLDASISLRRKIVKDKPIEKQEEKYVNPDWAKFGV